MKKLFLLLATGLIATASNAQEATRSMMFVQPNVGRYQPAVNQHTPGKPNLSGHLRNVDARTTSGSVGGGWYSYVDSVFAPNLVLHGGAGDAVQLNSMYMWTDSTAYFGYDNAGAPGYIGYGVPSAGYDYNVSCGLLFDPYASDWPTDKQIDISNGYTIDSVMVVGTYGRQAGATYTDQLHLSFAYGDGTAGSNIGVFYFPPSTGLPADYGIAPDTLWFPTPNWDTTSNGVVGTAPAGVSYNEPLTEADTNVTNFGIYGPYAVNVVVPAGNWTAMSVSMRSGDVSYATGDSITSASGNGGYYHGCFQPAIAFNYNGTAVQFPPYLGPTTGGTSPVTADYTTGYYKIIGYNDALYGWSPYYNPNWEYTAGGGGAYYEQYPYIIYHVKLPPTSAPTVKHLTTSVQAYPNPASDVVTIGFLLTSSSDVTISLTNIMGQVVASQNATGATGNVEFNTSALPAGIYIYTFNANGERTTGRIVVAH